MRSRAAFAAFFLAGVSASAQNGVERPRGAPYPDVIYPDDAPSLPDGFTITRPFRRPVQQAPRTQPDPTAINLPRDVPERLSACWNPPPVAENEVAQVTVRVSFTAEGAVIGVPMTPYLQAKTDDLKRALRASLLAAIKACTPLRFTPSLGRAIAGRIFALRFIVHHVASEQRT